MRRARPLITASLVMAMMLPEMASPSAHPATFRGDTYLPRYSTEALLIRTAGLYRGPIKSAFGLVYKNLWPRVQVAVDQWDRFQDRVESLQYMIPFRFGLDVSGDYENRLNKVVDLLAKNDIRLAGAALRSLLKFHAKSRMQEVLPLVGDYYVRAFAYGMDRMELASIVEPLGNELFNKDSETRSRIWREAPIERREKAFIGYLAAEWRSATGVINRVQPCEAYLNRLAQPDVQALQAPEYLKVLEGFALDTVITLGNEWWEAWEKREDPALLRKSLQFGQKAFEFAHVRDRIEHGGLAALMVFQTTAQILFDPAATLPSDFDAKVAHVIAHFEPDNALRLAVEGIVAFHHGRLEEAEAKLRPAIKAESVHHLCRRTSQTLLTIIQERQGKYEEALATLTNRNAYIDSKAVASDDSKKSLYVVQAPNTVYDAYLRGRLNARLERHSEAAKAWEELLKREPFAFLNRIGVSRRKFLEGLMDVALKAGRQDLAERCASMLIKEEHLSVLDLAALSERAGVDVATRFLKGYVSRAPAAIRADLQWLLKPPEKEEWTDEKPKTFGELIRAQWARLRSSAKTRPEEVKELFKSEEWTEGLSPNERIEFLAEWVDDWWNHPIANVGPVITEFVAQANRIDRTDYEAFEQGAPSVLSAQTLARLAAAFKGWTVPHNPRYKLLKTLQGPRGSPEATIAASAREMETRLALRNVIPPWRDLMTRAKEMVQLPVTDFFSGPQATANADALATIGREADALQGGTPAGSPAAITKFQADLKRLQASVVKEGENRERAQRSSDAARRAREGADCARRERDLRDRERAEAGRLNTMRSDIEAAIAVLQLTRQTVQAGEIIGTAHPLGLQWQNRGVTFIDLRRQGVVLRRLTLEEGRLVAIDGNGKEVLSHAGTIDGVRVTREGFDVYIPDAAFDLLPAQLSTARGAFRVFPARAMAGVQGVTTGRLGFTPRLDVVPPHSPPPAPAAPAVPPAPAQVAPVPEGQKRLTLRFSRALTQEMMADSKNWTDTLLVPKEATLRTLAIRLRILVTDLRAKIGDQELEPDAQIPAEAIVDLSLDAEPHSPEDVILFEIVYTPRVLAAIFPHLDPVETVFSEELRGTEAMVSGFFAKAFSGIDPTPLRLRNDRGHLMNSGDLLLRGRRYRLEYEGNGGHSLRDLSLVVGTLAGTMKFVAWMFAESFRMPTVAPTAALVSGIAVMIVLYRVVIGTDSSVRSRLSVSA